MKIIKATPDVPILLGRQGEKGITRVEFDLLLFIQECGQGTAQLIVKRATEDVVYPATVNQSGTTATWDIGAEWTATAGRGYCELNWYVGDALAKSEVYRTEVLPALDGTAAEDAPDPFAGYVDQVFRASGEAVEAAGAAKAAGQTAVGAATTAQASAQAAQTHAQAAQESAASAQQYAVGQFELVEDITTTEAVTSVNRTTWPDGAAYRLRAVYVAMIVPAASPAGNFNVYTRYGGATVGLMGVAGVNATSTRYVNYYTHQIHGLWETRGGACGGNYGSSDAHYFKDTPNLVSDYPVIDRLTISGVGDVVLPAGTKIKIYGVRA
jgi:hypothetical protein